MGRAERAAGTHQAQVQVNEVRCPAALAARAPVHAPEQVRDHELDIHSPGDRPVGSPVVPHDLVVMPERGHGADRGALLAAARVPPASERPVFRPFLEEILDAPREGEPVQHGLHDGLIDIGTDLLLRHHGPEPSSGESNCFDRLIQSYGWPGREEPSAC